MTLSKIFSASTTKKAFLSAEHTSAMVSSGAGGLGNGCLYVLFPEVTNLAALGSCLFSR